MKYLDLAALAAALCMPCAAKAQTETPRFTGQHLVDLLAVPPGAVNTLQLDARRQINYKVAQAYINSAIDLSEGVTWCSYRVTKPGTVDEKVIWGLRALPKERLQERAAPLIVDILRKQLPCARQQPEVTP